MRRKGEDKEAQQKALYQKLIETTEQMVRQSRQVVTALSRQTAPQGKRLLKQLEQVLPLVERVIKQTRIRVLEGKKVSSGEKVLSLFEPHTRAIPRHKGGALVEFGRQVMLDEVEGGIVTRYQILEHPEEHGQAIQAVAHHQQVGCRTHPTWSPPTVGFIRLTRSPHSRRQESGRSLSRLSARSLKNGTHKNIPANGGEGIAGARALRGESPVCDAIMDGANADTTGKTGWSGG